ncbi:transcriptional regulator [Natrarchaeobius halalkaliphilus]|uniref:Transcriptional regulator n=1 Tax=Natrarchaeobius halalkaliphilus TaxID=1679091 RepID=A0A3N6NZ53_9EURY|nr:transcriptional regulator [Natrarchaeobius halalkaliphilus]RQG86786.1 transcriptional regulator [Natrarchaeobius halalkaliphilus]
MTREDTESVGESLEPAEITERFNELEAGDTVTVNNHELTYDVIDTDTYSVIATDPFGQQVTFSQNLQSGGWTMSETVFDVEHTSG